MVGEVVVSRAPSRAGRDLLSPLARRPLQLALPGRSLQLAVPGCLPRLEARRDAGFRPGARCARSWPHPPHLRGCAGGRAFVLFRSRCRYSPAAAFLLGGNLASAPNARTHRSEICSNTAGARGTQVAREVESQTSTVGGGRSPRQASSILLSRSFHGIESSMFIEVVSVAGMSR